MMVSRLPVIHQVLCRLQGRSSKWPRVRKTHLKDNPRCFVCNGKRALEVHHVKPFRISPELELDPHNLITLCNHRACHLMYGHLGSFRSWNPLVWVMAANMKKAIRGRP